MNIAGGSNLEPVVIEGRAFAFQPTLRRAMRLQALRLLGGLQDLARDLQDGSLSTAVSILRSEVDMPDLELAVLRDIDQINGQLLGLVLACSGIEISTPRTKIDKPSEDNQRSTQTFEEFHADLYRIATGWLGWTPDTALDATIGQITQAYEGKLAMLKAVYGSGEKAEEDKPAGPWDRNVRSIFDGLGTIKETTEGETDVP